tara:strand:+ start:983 stop:3964 length:2982 start_codon:yes stop_codon:yes gene_type:complete
MAFFWAAVAFAGAATVSYVMAQKAQKAAQKAADDMAGVLVNKESNIEPIPVIYGTRRVGGVRVFVSSRDAAGGDPNEFLYIAMVLAEGEVDAITDIHIDDNPISDSKYNGLYTINVHTGADNQAYDSLLAQGNYNWTSAHKLSGVAYLAIKLKWDADVFQGVPDITALVRGRKVYDSREDSTSSGYVTGGVSTQRFTNPSTWTFSTNPSLCLRDYMTNTRFGKGLSASVIDDVAFSAAATDCDESVTFYTGGGTGKIFETNAVLQTDETLFSNIEKMLMGCRGFLPYTQGKYGLIIDKSRSVSYAFDTDTIVSGISIQGESKEDKFNRVIVKFANPAVDYQPDQATWPDAGSSEETTFLSEDNGTLLVTDLDMPTVTNYYAARDLARVILKRSRSSLRCSFKTTSEALQLSVGDVVTVTHPTPAWVAKPFQIEEITLNYDGTCSVSLLQYDSTIYTYDLAAQEITYPQSVLPDPFSVLAPTGFNTSATTSVALDGTIVTAIEASWTASTDSFVTQYDIQWSADGTNFQSVVTDNTRFIVSPVIAGATYYFKVRSINSLGVKSVFISSNQGSVGDTTAPSVVGSPSATAGQGSITLAWTNPADKDFSNAEIYRADTTGGTYTAIASVSSGHGLPSSFVNGSLADNEDYFYKIKSVDYSGNKSGFSAIVSATTNAATLPARADNGYVYYTVSQTSGTPANPSATDYDYDTASFSDLTDDWQKNPPTVNGADGKFWASSFTITEASFGGSKTITFSTPFASTQFDGLVTFTNLNSELTNASSTEITTINGGLLKTGTIEGDRIRIDGVGIDVVTNGTQKTLQIGDDGVTTVKINDLAVTQGKIANLAVDTLQIQNQAVTIPSGAFTAAEYYTSYVVADGQSGWQAVQQVTFTQTANVSTEIFWSLLGKVRAGTRFDDAEYANLEVRILRGTSVLINYSVVHSSNNSNNLDVQSMINGSLIDTPSTGGSVTYQIQVKRTGEKAQVSNRSLITTELKK